MGDLLNSGTGGKVGSGICSTNMIFFYSFRVFFLFVCFFSLLSSWLLRSHCEFLCTKHDGHHMLHCSSVPDSAPRGCMQNEAPSLRHAQSCEKPPTFGTETEDTWFSKEGRNPAPHHALGGCGLVGSTDSAQESRGN